MLNSGAPGPLAGRRILVVEHEYIQADDVSLLLLDEGASILGPCQTLEAALALVATHAALDAAVLDINLAGHFSTPLAEILRARGVPMLIATGYDELAVPATLRTEMRLEKPFDAHDLIAVLEQLVAGRRRSC